jgi:hypothetical protein
MFIYNHSKLAQHQKNLTKNLVLKKTLLSRAHVPLPKVSDS